MEYITYFHEQPKKLPFGKQRKKQLIHIRYSPAAISWL